MTVSSWLSHVPALTSHELVMITCPCTRLGHTNVVQPRPIFFKIPLQWLHVSYKSRKLAIWSTHKSFHMIKTKTSQLLGGNFKIQVLFALTQLCSGWWIPSNQSSKKKLELITAYLLEGSQFSGSTSVEPVEAENPAMDQHWLLLLMSCSYRSQIYSIWPMDHER